tara:strand:- start:749 stop:1888 length:1140 start_codon:yes stop_codon:yes gene_type:complete
MRKVEKIIQTLDVEGNCLGVYSDGEFYFNEFSNQISDKNLCWKHSPVFEKDEENTYLSLYDASTPLLQYSANPGSLRACDDLMRAQKKAAVTAKLDFSELCFYDIIPDHLLKNWFALRESAMKRLNQEVQRPSDYDILHKIHVLIENISKQKLMVAQSVNYVKYDMFSSATGRLATSRGSYPILNISKKEREMITPQNDMFLELDINGAEIRTLLAFSGVEQPTEDIHLWNMKEQPPWLTRKEAKEQFFAWLYNPKAENKIYEKHYNKDAYLQHFDGSTISTPFGRSLAVDDRRALNYLLQSTTSDIVLENSYKIMKRLKGLKSFVAFTMHDSVVLDFSREEHHLVSEIQQIFEENLFGRFLSTISIGKNFGNLKEISI